MTIDQAIEEAKKDFAEKFPDFNKDDDIIDEEPEDIIKGIYEPFACYAITIEGSCIVTDFLVTLTQKEHDDECPKFIYTIYDQALGKNGIYKFI